MDDLPEISPLSPPPEDRPCGDPNGAFSRAWRALGDRRVRLALTALILVAVLAYLLIQAIPGARQRVSALLVPPTPSATAIATRTPLPVPTINPALITPTPLPVVGLLPPAPSDCPAAPPLDNITAQPGGFSMPVQLFGRSPIWLPIGMGYPPNGTLAVGQPGVPDPYPSTLVIWEIGPTQYPEFTARASNLATGELAWWSSGGLGPQTPVLTLTPVDPAAPPPSEPAYFGWPMALYFTHSGCYKLDVTWTGGEWYTIFAVGGPS